MPNMYSGNMDVEVFIIIYHLTEDMPLPYVTPNGYNASLDGVAVQFTCILTQ